MEVFARQIRPQYLKATIKYSSVAASKQAEMMHGSFTNLPQTHDVREREFSFEKNEEPSEAEEHVAGVVAL